jgi:hypothetical protein
MKASLIVPAMLCLTAGLAGMMAAVTSAKLENARVKITEVRYEPGVPRERSIRASDQVIVFLDDCRYERIDSQTHAKEIRERKSGDVIWHNKGEDAPVLTNLGSKPYRTLVIELR